MKTPDNGASTLQAKTGRRGLRAAIVAHKWFLLVAAALLAVGAAQGARVYYGPAVVVDRVERGDLIETVVASGHVETPSKSRSARRSPAPSRTCSCRRGRP